LICRQVAKPGDQTKPAFRVKRTYPKILRNRKARIARRLDPKADQSARATPVMGARNIHFEMANRSRAINCGGIGAIHAMVQKLGLTKEIDRRLHLLKIHLPYHESDHVLNLAYNALLGGGCLDDIERRRNDEAFLDCLGAQRIPDPTTSGDFTRRFCPDSICDLMDAINQTRLRVWKLQPKRFLKDAFIDIDGSMAGTQGDCKAGMSLSYKGIWGYHPLIVSLGNTKEVLYAVNRPGNVTSHDGCVPWIDRAIALVRARAKQITLRGDTDYTLTGELDRWDKEGIRFILGMDAHTKVTGLAQALPEAAWTPLERLPKHSLKTQPRSKPERVKEQIVRAKGYTNQVLKNESLAELDYKPLKCAQSYRLIILRKNISVQKGEQVISEEVRHFFYITNRRDLSKRKVVELANGRCDQENVIEQLKNGVNAMRMPVNSLESNWAYLVMTALAWNLKAWFGLLMPSRERGMEVVRMEFKRFLESIVLLPAQIVRTGRRIVFRILHYNSWLKDFFAAFERVQELAVT
jgi:hypothetical protein